jgi:hypothetical protein
MLLVVNKEGSVLSAAEEFRAHKSVKRDSGPGAFGSIFDEDRC